jgi:hypothetical protein
MSATVIPSRPDYFDVVIISCLENIHYVRIRLLLTSWVEKRSILPLNISNAEYVLNLCSGVTYHLEHGVIVRCRGQ